MDRKGASASRAAGASRKASSETRSCSNTGSAAGVWKVASVSNVGSPEMSGASIGTAVGSIPSGSSRCSGIGTKDSGRASRSCEARAASSGKCGTTGRGRSRATITSRIALAASATRATPSLPGVRWLASERFMKPSTGAVTSVSAMTSVIANAPFIVWTARSNWSFTGCGPRARQASSQASTVSRCPATSGLRISNSTGSIEKPASSPSSAGTASAASAGTGSASRGAGSTAATGSGVAGAGAANWTGW